MYTDVYYTRCTAALVSVPEPLDLKESWATVDCIRILITGEKKPEKCHSSLMRTSSRSDGFTTGSLVQRVLKISGGPQLSQGGPTCSTLNGQPLRTHFVSSLSLRLLKATARWMMTFSINRQESNISPVVTWLWSSPTRGTWVTGF